jgi:phytoene dehydrogenase-like protein
VKDLRELPRARAVLCDVTPRQFLQIAGTQISASERRALQKYRYGPGSFKIDWALDAPIPWTADVCRRAGTIHLGGTLEEIAESESAPWNGKHTERPFVFVAQPSLFDPTRAPAGKHTAWAYCHVPNASTFDMRERVEAQIERFAPGFRERILARSIRFPADLEAHNANLVGGDISGGANELGQFFMRPTRRMHSTSIPNVFLCSSSTPPGAGVHGMCGHIAAQLALNQCF